MEIERTVFRTVMSSLPVPQLSVRPPPPRPPPPLPGNQVVVKNEFHLPYRAVIRVYFGKNSLKTIEATAVPKSDGETTLHWRLYRNFAITHPRDEGPINKVRCAGCQRGMMDACLFVRSMPRL